MGEHIRRAGSVGRAASLPGGSGGDGQRRAVAAGAVGGGFAALGARAGPAPR